MSNDHASYNRRGDRHIMMIAAVVVVQAVAAAFFMGDAAFDLATGEWGWHMVSEVLIAFALLAGVVLGARQTRIMLQQSLRDAEALSVARGAVADLLDMRFRQWKLSNAEAEVALFAMKGCEVAEIAELRNVAEGTVRAQLTAIYAKAGVASRHALISLLIEDLIDEGAG